MKNKEIIGEDVAALLHGIHTHAELLLKYELEGEGAHKP